MKTEISPLQVVIADDSLQVRRELRTLLELTGTVQVVGEAGDGQHALDLARRLRPDVVVMDLEMPGMDGCAATRAIKQRALTRRVVILSVHRDPYSVQRVREAGADELIQKGAPLEELLNAMKGAK